MKLIVAGGRDFNNYSLLSAKLDFFLKKVTEPIEIVSGGQRTRTNPLGSKYHGADFLGEVYAKERGYPLKVFKADWDKFNRAAGMIRNREMGDYASHLVAFWDGKFMTVIPTVDTPKPKEPYKPFGAYLRKR